MNFYEAIKIIEEGKKVVCKGRIFWKENGMFLRRDPFLKKTTEVKRFPVDADFKEYDANADTDHIESLLDGNVSSINSTQYVIEDNVVYEVESADGKEKTAADIKKFIKNLVKEVNLKAALNNKESL